MSGVVATSLDSDDLAKIRSPVADVAGADLFATDHSAFLACFLAVVVVVAGAIAAAADDAAADGTAVDDAGIGRGRRGADEGGIAAIEAEPAEAAGTGRRTDGSSEDEELALTCPKSKARLVITVEEVAQIAIIKGSEEHMTKISVDGRLGAGVGAFYECCPLPYF